MRGGVVFSIAFHVALLAGGIVIAPKLMADEPAPMMILPVELLTIADTTNVAPVAEKQPEKTEEADTSADKAAPTPAAAPEEKPEPVPEPVPVEAKKPTPEPPKDEPKAKPEPKKSEKMADTLDSILKSVPDKKASKNPSDRATANLRNVEDAARKGAGDNQRMTVTIADSIRSQLMSRGCWTDKDDMPDAKRLHATIRVRFERGGRLLGEPQLMDPPRQSASDRPMTTFITQAMSSLRQCEPFQVPPEYYATSPYIDLTFVP
jgi:outer membrane biosynthesis protein TonB